MKQILILFLFLLIALTAKSQSVTSEVNTQCDSLIMDYDWKVDSLLREAFREWEHVDFFVLLKKHKVGKISCAGCDGVSAKIQFYLNSKGKMQSIKLMQSNKCGFSFDEKFTIDFITSLSAIVFPEILRNKCYQFYVGRRLKC